MSKILFAVSGSIAAFKAAQVASQLVQRGHEVQVVTTSSALKFVGTATWEGLTGRPTVSDIFADGHQMDHIHLARWAEKLILCPASAHAISQWAAGAAADLPSALFLAFERTLPTVIAPAMNKEMWAHPAVQENIKKLATWNVRMIEPEDGALACGEFGAGRLASPDRIVAALESAGEPIRPCGRVLVTSGATREPIDGVRFITNVSTGRTGAAVADKLASAGYGVVYLHGPNAELPIQTKIEKYSYSDFRSLEKMLRDLLRQPFAAVIHAAAVSDFSVERVGVDKEPTKSGGKLDSNQDLTIELRRNPKLLLNLKEWSTSSSPAIVAFKLTDTGDEQAQKMAVDRLLSRAEIDAVVWNDLKDVSPERHGGRFYSKDGKSVAFANNAELGTRILDFLGSTQYGDKDGLGHRHR